MSMMYPSSFCAAAFLVWASVLPSHAAPEETDIRTAIVERLEDGLALDAFRFKVFVNDDTSRGRVSISGTLKLTEDRVRRMDRQSEIIHEDLQRNFGIHPQRAIAIGRMIGRAKRGTGSAVVDLTFFTVEQAKNTTVPFTAELQFLETVNGFSFENPLIYEVCCEVSSKVLANPRNHLFGGDEYLSVLNVFEEWWTYETITIPEVRRALFGPLDGARMLYDDGTEVARITDLQIELDSGNISNSNADDRPGLYPAMHTKALATITPARSFNIGFIELEAGQPYLYEFNLVYPYEMERLDQACIEMKEAVGSYWSGTICFDGSGFSWNRVQQYGGIADNRAEKRLEIRY